jgi:PBP1b-binding outer membrane lipoprotein LpoB
MKKLKLLLVLCISAILFSSCAGFSTIYPKESPAHTQVLLQENNFRVIKTVEGEWSATYILGIGGLSKESLLNSATSNMYKNAQLTGSQTIINITSVVSSKTILGIYTKKTAIVSGTMIEFIE